MGKTSSSHKKKKHSKKSSKVRSRKISKSSNRKRKSKKLRRNDSISDSSDDDSRSSISVSSYSSSEDEYRSRRARSRTKKDVKSGKKRVRRRSSSPEDSRRMRKKKGSKKDDGSRGRKRTYQKKKKKARRDASVSSADSFDSSESEYEREKESGEGNIDKVDRYRWMDQPTLYDQHTESNDQLIEEKGMGEKNSRRLRSVIIVIKQEQEGSDLDNEKERKEEIVCDHDDYPSCRSNDSNEGGSKKESDHNSSFDSEKKVEKEEDPCSEARDPTGDPNGEDLESVLRRRALENLKKFRVKGPNDNDPREQTLAVKVEPLQNKPPEETCDRADLSCSLQGGENSSEGGEGANHNAHVSTLMEPPIVKSPSEAIISKEPEEEAKEASQYEQKTMSVMRGGEMVQVSYSVYIPKKTPALARRQLKR